MRIIDGNLYSCVDDSLSVQPHWLLSQRLEETTRIVVVRGVSEQLQTSRVVI